MKKLTFGIGTLALALTLASCGGTTPTTQQANTPFRTSETNTAVSTDAPEAGRKSGTLSAQGSTTTYTKLASWNQTFVVPQGVTRVYFNYPSNLQYDYDPSQLPSKAVTPGQSFGCNAQNLGWENSQIACYSAVYEEANYSTTQVELQNRWDSSYNASYDRLWYKLQISSASYSRGRYNTEWIKLTVNYVPTYSEVQAARQWLTSQGSKGKVLTDPYNKVAYAIYAYNTAPNSYGQTGGLRASTYDPAGPYSNTVIVR